MAVPGPPASRAVPPARALQRGDERLGLVRLGAAPGFHRERLPGALPVPARSAREEQGPDLGRERRTHRGRVRREDLEARLELRILGEGHRPLGRRAERAARAHAEERQVERRILERRQRDLVAAVAQLDHVAHAHDRGPRPAHEVPPLVDRARAAERESQVRLRGGVGHRSVQRHALPLDDVEPEAGGDRLEDLPAPRVVAVDPEEGARDRQGQPDGAERHHGEGEEESHRSVPADDGGEGSTRAVPASGRWTVEWVA